MNDNIIRVGIVGAGANTTSRHIPGLQSIDGVEITLVFVIAVVLHLNGSHNNLIFRKSTKIGRN